MTDPFLGYGDEIFAGFLVTISLAVCSLFFGLIWGVLAARAKLSNKKVLNIIGDVFTTVGRGTPELLIILIVFFGSTTALTSLFQIFSPETSYVEVPPFVAGTFALSLVFGAYATEIFRSAVLAVPVKEVEAGIAVGMTKFQLFFYVKLPNIWRISLPGLGNHWLGLIKDTSLVSVVGLEEMMRLADIASAYTHQPFRFYCLVTAIYLVFNFLNNESVGYLERKANQGRG